MKQCQYMKKIFLSIMLAGSMVACKSPQSDVSFPKGQLPFDNPYAFGLDLSFVNRAEHAGAVYYDIDGTEKSPWQIFADHGYNWGRLMVCNEPSRLGQGLDNLLEGARKLKEHNYHFALDFMMADGWSNPMTQPMPESFKGMSHAERVAAFHDYVYHVVSTLDENGVCPEIVQVGNEISNGAFWPDGRIYYGEEKKHLSHWKEFTEYISAGAKAIREVSPSIRVMLHVDFGGDLDFTDTFFSKMQEYKVDYDIIGYSFYPWSHGTLIDLRDNLYYTIKKFGKPVIVIETGYYSEPSGYFEKKGERGPLPETPEGQKEWFQAVNEIVMAAPDHMGLGVFWWEPMFAGRGFFDDRTHVAKPIVTAFEKYAFPLDRFDGNPRLWDFEPGEKPAN